MASRIGAQSIIIGAAGFVVGLLIGGIAPRLEASDLESEIARLEKKKASQSGTEASRELVELITGGLEKNREQTARKKKREEFEGEPEEEEVRHDQPDAEPEELAPAKDYDELEAMRELLTARSAQAHAALVEDIDPSDDQMRVIDAAVEQMNNDLHGLALEFASTIEAGEEPSRRELMSLGADVLDTLVAAETAVLDTMDADQLDDVREESTDPTSFVSPAVIDVLLEVDLESL